MSCVLLCYAFSFFVHHHLQLLILSRFQSHCHDNNEYKLCWRCALLNMMAEFYTLVFIVCAIVKFSLLYGTALS